MVFLGFPKVYLTLLFLILQFCSCTVSVSGLSVHMYSNVHNLIICLSACSRKENFVKQMFSWKF